ALRVLPPRDFVGAVESIPEVVEMIEKLLASGAAYRVDDPEYPDVYFDRSFTGRFGYESNYDGETMRAIFPERGGDPDRPGKRDPLDALLWRVERPREPAWDSSLGRGRPGWHIECSAIALKHLGIGFDVQGGGSDPVFPHHEFSAAHAEAMTGEHRVARRDGHAGMIGPDGEQVSNPCGNRVFAPRLRAGGVDLSAARLALFAGHYRDDRERTDERLKQANSRLARWREGVSRPSGPD